MLGMKEICALLLAGGMGAGSVVGVQQVKPVVHKAVAKKAPAPKAHKTAATSVARAVINDCPTIAGGLGGGIANLAPLPSFESLAPGSSPNPQIAFGGPILGGFPGPGIGSGGGGNGGGESGPSILPPTPAVPEPVSWAMMVGGLGMVGLALRRSGPPKADIDRA